MSAEFLGGVSEVSAFVPDDYDVGTHSVPSAPAVRGGVSECTYVFAGTIVSVLHVVDDNDISFTLSEDDITFSDPSDQFEELVQSNSVTVLVKTASLMVGVSEYCTAS